MPLFDVRGNGKIVFGDNFILCSLSDFSALGVRSGNIFRVSDGAILSVGNNCGFSGCVIYCTAGISIGDGLLAGADVMIIDNDFHPVDVENRFSYPYPEGKPIFIGKNVFLGSGVKILKGVSVGDNSVIAAGSIVVSDIPSNCIAGGIPCAFIKSIELK
ncbi:acyltransferase [Sphaerotilus sulfidivorans]|uniref:acyltransferase n=1 Tax=Sphaerotilus sp. FB-3 TaxID=2913396 RepID=UPI00203A3D16|nr:acyltransferase [Sphaerotilus sp. FB-3]GKQ58440.1 hypothetical protein QMTAC487_23000 [Sphaerotilus sp. FB-3]